MKSQRSRNLKPIKKPSGAQGKMKARESYENSFKITLNFHTFVTRKIMQLRIN